MSSTLDAATAALPSFCAVVGSVVYVTDVIGAVLVMGFGAPRIVVHICGRADFSEAVIAYDEGETTTIAVTTATAIANTALTVLI